MHQKAILASKQPDDIKYGPNLVQQLFLRILERGIAVAYLVKLSHIWNQAVLIMMRLWFLQ